MASPAQSIAVAVARTRIRDEASDQSNWVDTYVPHRAGVNVSAGQQAVVSGGTEQALCGPYDGLGEAGMMLRGHG